jgi:type I restriction enzyme S subunit
MRGFFDCIFIVALHHTIAGGSTMPIINKGIFSSIDIRIPSLNNQKAIVSVLSALDFKIELNNAINKNLEEMAQALFKRWFVDFEFPNENGKPYKSSRGEFETSELGPIPKGWKTGYFGDISICYDSKRIPLSKKEREVRKKVYPYYGAASVMDYVDQYLFNGVHVLMGEDGTVINDKGYPVLQYVWGKFWVNNHAHVLKGKSDFSEEYIYLLLKRTNVRHIVTGAVQPKINQANMKGIKVIIPENSVLNQFNQIIDGLFKLIRKNSDENYLLTQLSQLNFPNKPLI